MKSLLTILAGLFSLTTAWVTGPSAPSSTGMSPNRCASATIQGIRQIKALHYLVAGTNLLEVIELIPPSGYSADTTSIIKSIDNSQWQTAITELQGLALPDRIILMKLVYEIQRKVEVEAKKARRMYAPNKDHLAQEWKTWREINSAVHYMPPQRMKPGTDFSSAPAVYTGTTKVNELRLTYATSDPNDGISLFPKFDLINIPCFGVKIDLKLTVETPPGAPHPFRKNKYGQMDRIEISGNPTMLLNSSRFNTTTFLLNGRSPSVFSLFLDDKDITLPPGVHRLNIHYRVFLDEVPAAESNTVSIRYHKH